MEKTTRLELAKQTHSAIWDAAISLFISNGYRPTSMEKIAQAAGVAKGTIYIYYKSKKELFREVCRYSVEQFLKRIDAVMEGFDGDHYRCVEGVLLAKFMYFHEYFATSPDRVALLAAGRDIGKDIYAEGDRAFQERVEDVVRRAHEAGELVFEGTEETVEGFASLLVIACHGVGIELPSERYEKTLSRIIMAIWRGYQAGLS